MSTSTTVLNMHFISDFLPLHSIQHDFMKSFQTQPIMWATDWPVTRRTTQSPTPLPLTPLSHFCPNTPTTPHNPLMQPPAAAAAPPHQKTPSPLPHTPQPSLSTPPCRAWLLLPLGWQRTLSPKSSTSDWTLIQTWPFPKRTLENCVSLWTARQFVCPVFAIWGGSEGQKTMQLLFMDLWDYVHF